MSPAWSGPWEVSKQREKSQTTIRQNADRDILTQSESGEMKGMDQFMCIQVTQPDDNSIHLVGTFFTSFSFQLGMELNNKHEVEERLRKKEGKKLTMTLYCICSCLR